MLTRKQKVTSIAFALAAVLITRYAVLNEPGEFSRFYEVVKAWVVPPLLVLIVIMTVGLLIVARKKPAPAKQEQLIRLSYWGSSIFCGLIFVSAIIYTKLSV